MATDRRFHWADYLVFCGSLGISLIIGIHYALQDRKKTSTADYLLGGRNMGVLPVAASLVVTMVSAIFVQGVPVEIYSYGMYYTFAILGYAMAILISSIFFHPIYHRLGITSVYEYLEMRFSREVRIACSIVTMFQMVCYSSVALYAPTIAISKVTGIPYYAGIVLFAALCTCYTTLGGFKTVIWTDTLQCGIMFIGMTATLIKASMDIGGLSKAMEISAEGGRQDLSNIVPNPLQRQTVWNWLFGDFPFYLSMYAVGQFAVQRFCSVKSVNKARLAMTCAIPIYCFLNVFASIIGCVAYAYYKGCDPYLAKRIVTRDQIVAVLVMDVFEHYPGMAGIFLSSIMSAALSTLSSVQNSFAAILLEDFLKPLKLKITRKPISEKQATIASKVIVCFVGVAIMLMAILVSKTGKLVITLAGATLTLGAAPILGLFTIGIFMPFANNKGAIAGLISGIGLLGWIVIGSLTLPYSLHSPLPVSTKLCPVSNNTGLNNFTMANSSASYNTLNNFTDANMVTTPVPTPGGGISQLYRVSFSWYALIGCAPTIVIGTLVSLLTGGRANSKNVRSDLLFSFEKHGLPFCSPKAQNDELSDSDRTEVNLSETEGMLRADTPPGI